MARPLGRLQGGMTWVSYDPLGYVTHHYGRWGWSSIHGWYWIPGVFYSPAWVVWNMVESCPGNPDFFRPQNCLNDTDSLRAYRTFQSRDLMARSM
ncbi:MAG: hypothetical protein LBQ86_03800 [Holophagales bacterium]|nr:hypothetical protein [Holophagales bacterium]